MMWVLGTASVLGLLWLLYGLFAGRHRQDVLLGELQRTTMRLREAQALASIADFRWFVDSGKIQWSDEAFHLYGRPLSAGQPSVDEVFGQIHAEDRGRAHALADALIADGTPVTAEFRIIRPDGALRWIHATAEAVDENGRMLLRGVQQDITALASVRERLRETEEQYRFLFEHNPLPMWVFDRATLTFLAANDAMALHYGYGRDELLGRSILDIRPAEDKAAVAATSRLCSADRPQGRVWTHLRKDGTRLRAAVFTHDIDFDGRPARLVSAQDVTEREATEQRFQLVARATSDAIWDWDFAKDITWRSDNVYALFGYQPGEILGSMGGWAALLHPDDRVRVETSVRKAIDSDAEGWECEYRLRRKDGSYADVLDRGFFMRDELGKAVRAVGGMVDVTQKHRDDADLRLLRRAVESTDNGIVIADARLPDLPLVYVNPSFEQMTGYGAAEVLGSNCRFLQGTDQEQVGLQSLRLAIAEQREARVVLRNYRKDGTLFWNELHLAPVQDEDGSVSHFVGIQTDVSHRHYYEQELAHRATHDQLTGLPNRQLIMDRLQQAILNADRYGRGAGVVFIDLDDFKLINDSLDHAAGDKALRVVAERLRGLVRDTDTVGRLGGDEFVIVLTEQIDESGVEQVLKRVSVALSAPIDIGGLMHTITPSIGWCRYPDGGQDADTLLKHADVAMYQAKRQGRNRVVAYDPGFDAHVSQRLQLVAQLRDALERAEFELAFQPLYDGEGVPVALEALARWRHPERGLLPPSEFITICEESGLIIQLGRYVLREAARHHALLVAAGYPQVRIAVNVSALQFGYALEEDVAGVVEEFQLPAGILELEITESVILEHPERAIEAMQRISALGVCLSVDDFGTGYSSLAYLRRLPIHRLKIDRSFVEDLPDDREAASICESIIALAHSLHLQTVGEGVETQAQLQWLRANGCDEVQGFLLARPAPFADILATLIAGGSGTPA
jgi:diguanylate cyclase (GGDEF)-like protein/PAS domain S-box-containing protein